MSLQRILRSAFSSVGGNKLRSGLTLLGVVIGVAAVISLMSIGRGSQAAITERIQSLGTNLLFVSPTGADATLSLDDAYALVDPVFAPSVGAVAPELNTSGPVVFGKESTTTQIVGVTPEYERVREADVETGTFISVVHVQNASDVVVLGSTVSETLFGSRIPIGQIVKINGRQFTVIGILESSGGTAFGNQDDRVLVPLTTAYFRLASQRNAQGEITVQTISAQITNVDDMDRAQDEISRVLRLRHRITGEDDFRITSQQDTLETLEETTETFVVFLGAIAGISLLVGGIGIMNIMLVSVTERTREIGIRKAVGAKRRDILLQFISEATILSLGGGVLGVLLGIGLSIFLDDRTVLGQSFQTVFSTDVAALALVVSAVIGLFFGIYPAIRAASLHPIEALRFE